MLKVIKCATPSPEQMDIIVQSVCENPKSYMTHIEDPVTLNTVGFEYFLDEDDISQLKRDGRYFYSDLSVSMIVEAPIRWFHEYIYCDSQRWFSKNLKNIVVEDLVVFQIGELRNLYRRYHESDDENWKAFCEFLEGLWFFELIKPDPITRPSYKQVHEEAENKPYLNF